MSYFLPWQIHGGADHDGGGLLDVLTGLLAFFESLSSPQSNNADGGFAWFSGLASMSNHHPVLVHFPIALLITFFLFDSAGFLAKKLAWRAAASYLLYFGTIAAAFTVWAGFIAADSVAHGENVHAIMERHEHLGLAVLALASSLSIWRARIAIIALQGVRNILFLSLAALLCGILSLGADLGGLMVYRYGVAVQAVAVPADSTAHHHLTTP